MRRLIGCAVGGVFAASASAQVPVPVAPAPPVAPVPAAAAPVVPAVPVAPPQRNIWSFFCLTPEQKAAKAAKKERFCKSPLGQLLHGMTKPIAAVSGGIVGGCCPPDSVNPLAPSPEDLAKPATDAEGAAARIKKLEAEAAERRAAVKYLGTVNCRRFPEAEAALVNALRTDTNECVRFEAALALTRGCCCTPKTIQALTLTVSGGTADGNPEETSPRVRAAAAQALSVCAVRASEAAPPEPPAELPPPERPPPVPTIPVARGPAEDPVTAAARKALDDYYAGSAPVRAQFVTGRRSVADAYRAAGFAPIALPPPETPQQTPQPAPPPMPPVVTPASAVVVPPVPAPAPVQPAATRLPPTGQRNLFQILKNAMSKP